MSHVEKALKRLRALDLDLPARPKKADHRETPEDVVRLNLRNLGRYHAGHVSWGVYANGQLAKLEVRAAELERALKLLETRLSISGGVRKDRRRWEVLERVRSDPRWEAMSEKLFLVNAQRKLLNVVASSYDRTAAMLSRELARRGLENETK